MSKNQGANRFLGKAAMLASTFYVFRPFLWASITFNYTFSYLLHLYACQLHPPLLRSFMKRKHCTINRISWTEISQKLSQGSVYPTLLYNWLTYYVDTMISVILTLTLSYIVILWGMLITNISHPLKYNIIERCNVSPDLWFHFVWA